MNIRKGLNKTYSLLMVATGDKFALIYATDVVMQLMFGSGIRVAYNIYTEIDQRRFEREFNDKKDNHG